MIPLRQWAEENNPDLLEEWSEKNAPMTPESFGFGSHQKVWWKGKCGHEWKTQIKSRTNGLGCPYCAGKMILLGFNDLKSQAPELMPQWSERNLPAKPEEFTYKSDKKAWWIGPCGHEWQAIIKNRVNGAGCPYCTNHKLLIGFNDLKTRHPEIAREWSRKNNKLKPTMVTPMSNKKVLWKCHTCGYEWQARISERSRGSKCPVCAGKIIVAGINDFATTDPEIAAEWSEKNQKLDMESLSRYSAERVWWKCHICGHEWRAAINYRCRGHNCPACNRKTRHEELQEKRILEIQGKQFRKEFMDLLLRYYAEKYEIRILFDDSSAIGMPVKYYFPDQKGILEISGKTSVENRRRERIKNSLCNRNDIWMIRLLYNGEPAYDDCICIEMESDTEIEQYEAIQTVLEMLKIQTEGDMEKDMMAIFLKFQE